MIRQDLDCQEEKHCYSALSAPTLLQIALTKVLFRRDYRAREQPKRRYKAAQRSKRACFTPLVLPKTVM